jgi:integrase
MKMKTPHLVPLATQTLEALQVLRLVTSPNKAMSNNTLLSSLNRMGYKGRMTGHGFRDVASIQLHEMGFKHEVIELQLAHQQRNSVSATYIKRRVAMTQYWGDYLKHCTDPNHISAAEKSSLNSF